jgi:hypothetical protein
MTLKLRRGPFVMRGSRLCRLFPTRSTNTSISIFERRGP